MIKNKKYTLYTVLALGALLVLPLSFAQAGPICTGASCFVLGSFFLAMLVLIYGTPVVIALLLILSLIYLKRGNEKKFIIFSNLGIAFFIVAAGVVAAYSINESIQIKQIRTERTSSYINIGFPVQVPTGLEADGYQLIQSEIQKPFSRVRVVLHYRKGSGAGIEQNIILSETKLTDEFKIPEKCYVFVSDFYSCKYFSTTPKGTKLYTDNQPAEYIFEKDGAVVTLTMWMSDIKDTNKFMSIVDSLHGIPGEEWVQKLKEQNLF